MCIPNPCKNGGQCLGYAGGYKCLCTAGYKGNICDGKVPVLPLIWFMDASLFTARIQAFFYHFWNIFTRGNRMIRAYWGLNLLFNNFSKPLGFELLSKYRKIGHRQKKCINVRTNRWWYRVRIQVVRYPFLDLSFFDYSWDKTYINFSTPIPESIEYRNTEMFL